MVEGGLVQRVVALLLAMTDWCCAGHDRVGMRSCGSTGEWMSVSVSVQRACMGVTARWLGGNSIRACTFGKVPVAFGVWALREGDQDGRLD